jgi:hypothetical protein
MTKPKAGSTYQYKSGYGLTYKVKVTSVTAKRVNYKIIGGTNGSVGATRSMTLNQWAVAG